MSVYMRNASQIAAGEWRDYHFFQSIGYPLFVNSLKNFSSNYYYLLTIIQTLCSCVTLCFIYFAAKESFGRRIARISLLVSSLHLPWILYSNFALPELVFTMFLSICAWSSVLILHQKKVFISSLIWGLSFACALWLKGTHAFLGPLFYIGLLFTMKKKALPALLISGSVVFVSLCIHGALTYNKIGRVQMSASTGGLNFIEGKCPWKKNRDSVGFEWQSPLYFQLQLNDYKVWPRPFTDSGYFFKEGLKCIKDNPIVLIQSFEAIPYLFYGNHLWPFNQKQYGNFSRLYDLFFSFFVVVGLAAYWITFRFSRASTREFVAWSIPVISLFLCVYVFKAELRYRIPFDIWLIPLGVKGWGNLLEKRRIS